MRKTNISVLNPEERILIDTPSLQALLSCGYKTAVRLGMDAGARITVGRRILWNRKRIEQYLTDIEA